jgi:uncharacterized cupredoxin-like copper-binding protein
MHQDMCRVSGLFMTTMLAVAMNAGSSWAADSTLKIDLLDGSSEIAISGMAMAMHADHAAVPAGDVTFDVRNRSATLMHEVVIVRLDHAGQNLPYNSQERVVAEGDVHRLGEVSDLPPGGHGTLRLALAAGNYMLICNQPGHYHAGMKLPLTVTP